MAIGDDLTETAIEALAVYRVVKLIREDKIMEKPREWFWRRYPPETTMPGYLSSCAWCLSIYAGAAVSAGRIVAPKVTRAITRALALSAIAGIITEREESRDDGF